MVKLYEELTISDDFMFGNAMGDKVVRLDMYTRDKKRMYDAELQNQRKCRRICGSYMIISEPGRSEET